MLRIHTVYYVYTGYRIHTHTHACNDETETNTFDKILRQDSWPGQYKALSGVRIRLPVTLQKT